MPRRINSRKRAALMRKRLLLCAAACLLLFGLVLLGRHVIARKAVEAGFAHVTGFPLEIHSVQISPFLSRFEANGVRLRNPRGFPPSVFAEIPRVYIDYQVGSLWRREKRITWMELYIEELVIIKNRDGRYNYQELPGLGSTNDPAASSRFQIETLHLEMDYVTIRDCSGPQPNERTLKLRLNETFFDVDQDTNINRLVLRSVLRKVRFTDVALHSEILKASLGRFIRRIGDLFTGRAAKNSRQ
jgi:hypothetical protein